jgi:hypothetical protein
MMDAAPPEIFVKIRCVTKIRILFLYWDNPVKENRQLEKLNYRVGLVRSPEATVKLSSSQNPQRVLFHLLGLRGGFVELRLEVSAAMSQALLS